ncbi:MAG: PASTA domain-containing protein [Clostridia bacterium]|nr:PASTA domain-containing protein [Clostridia bacterium]MBN2881956.1 PASTA domain-containing protein [Clostridia bacterium]
MARRTKKAKKPLTEQVKRKNRLLVLLILSALVAAALLARVAYIQFVMGEELRKSAYRQQNNGRILSPTRGNIYDRTGNELAVSVAVDNVTVSPVVIKNTSNDPAEIAEKLSQMLGFKVEDILRLLVKDSEFEIIARKIDRVKGDEIRKWIDNDHISGVYVVSDTKRYYPNNELAAHILGFTGADNQGLFGIEAAMESYLKGMPGKVITEVDKNGTELPFAVKTEIKADDGLNLVLTIDRNLQRIAEEVLAKGVEENKAAGGGTAIIADSRTGEILAMASYPSYNLNEPRINPVGYEASEWDGYSEEATDLLSKTRWRNESLSKTYEPGSTFKAVIAAMALEMGVVDLDDIVDDYPVEVQGHTIYCWAKQYPHGEETFREAIYNSCNPVFVKVSQDIGIDRFYEYVDLFGFMDKTGIEIPGEENSLFHSEPMEIDMAVASFGQRFTITPLQLVSAYNALANGGYLMKPYLVKEIIDDEGNIIERFEPEVVRQVISEETSDLIREVLEGVVSEGTGKNAFVPGYRVAGKTGTSETTEEDVYTASFCGFAPADNPLITVLVILDDPRGDSVYGGVIAAPLMGEIVEKSLEYLQVPRKGDEDYYEVQALVPDITGYTMAEAVSALKDSNLEYVIRGDANGEDVAVVYQNPTAGELVSEKSVIYLYKNLPEEKPFVSMPDLRNMTIGEVKNALAGLGLNIRIDGSGICTGQEYSSGTKIEQGTVVEVKFRYLDTVQ